MNTPLSLLRLGYYRVGDQVILNKANALLEASRLNVPAAWVFNDDVYSKFDWSVPISRSLTDLYRERAQQLRDKYDHLVLYYSGGADSTNMLHAFVDNNIFVDEIVMQYPFNIEHTFNNKDTRNSNYFSEVKYAAAVHLDQIKNKLTNTVIRYLDQCQDTFDLFADPYWFEKYPLGTMITPAGAGRQISAIKDPMLDKLYTQGKKICQLYGVDKPLVSVVNGEFYAHFRDANATHAVPTGFELGEIASTLFNLEFFYWTPDLPEIVIKQAQIIKEAAIKNPTLKSLCLHAGSKIENFRKYLHPLIYCNEAQVCAFQTDKPTSEVYRSMDHWFWTHKEHHVAHNNFLSVIAHLGNNIVADAFVNQDVKFGLKPLNSRAYKL